MSGVLQVIHCMVRLWSGQFKAQNNDLWLRLFCIMLLLRKVHASVWCILLIVPVQCSNHYIFFCSCPVLDFTNPKNLDAEFVKSPHGACQLTGCRRQNTTIALIIGITVITSVTSAQLVQIIFKSTITLSTNDTNHTVLFGSKYWEHSVNIHTIIWDSSEFLKWMTVN